MSRFTEWVAKRADEVTGGASAWWNGLSIINKTRIGTGAVCFAVGFLSGAVLL